MRKPLNYKQKALICVPIFLVICVVLMWQLPNVTADDGIVVWWYSVIPPLIAIALAVITTRLFFESWRSSGDRNYPCMAEPATLLIESICIGGLLVGSGSYCYE